MESFLLLSSILQAVLFPFLIPNLKSEVTGLEEMSRHDILSGLFCPCCSILQIKSEFD